MKISTTALLTGDGVPKCPLTFGRPDQAFPCRGEECAAWRWSRAKETDAFVADVHAHMQAAKVPNFGTAANQVFADKGPNAYEKTEGYCGFGGKPE